MQWDYYYNLEGNEKVRANLVYTPYVSTDKQTFCMSFNRDPKYHKYPEEEAQWTPQDLVIRFEREIKFRERAAAVMPTLAVKDIDIANRKIFLQWHGDDFYMQAIKGGGYDAVLPSWKEQWTALIRTMQSYNIIKFSLHPNSWTVKDGVLIPFNWFYTYDRNEQPIIIRDMLKQISIGRQEKLRIELEKAGFNLDTPYPVTELQKIAFNSFRSNYPEKLINDILQ
jgi:hypothetical protein